jgi:DNA-binding winged helix-turn-helix (wHTH) protein
MRRILHRFSGFTFDVAGRRLLRDGRPVPLTGKPFDILAVLVARPKKLVTKEELIEAVWGPGADVSDESLSTHVSAIRQATGREAGLIKSVYGQGYRFAADVVATADQMSVFAAKLQWLTWIGYSPVGYDEMTDDYPSVDALRKDLRVLRSAGFDGLITFRARGTLAQIPRIAHDQGFKGVIAGLIGERQGVKEMAPWVDSFCVSHNQMFTSEALIGLMDEVREAAGRPVTATWYLGSDEPLHEAVADACDWLFPDVGVLWREEVVPVERQLDDLKQKVRRAAKLAAARGTVAMLKMVSCPSGGFRYTPAVQRAFFQQVLRYYRSPDYPYPASVALSYFSAFDIHWKTPERNFSPCERHTGLFDEERQPKAAVAAFDSPRR